MRTSRLKYLFVLLCLLIFTNESSASHGVGGDLTYKYLGNNFYKLELNLYIDCINGLPSAISGDTTIPISVFRANNILDTTVKLVRTGPTRVIGKNFSCASPPANACVDLYVLTGIAYLPPISGGYTLAYQRCCRNRTIENIIDPLSTKAGYLISIPDITQIGFNSSPQFNELPPNFLCKDEPLEFDHSATDLDGDSLVYSLCTPNKGSAGNGSSSKPPFLDIDWRSPYSEGNQMGGNPMLSINPVTGLLKVIPNRLGQYVVGICVKEYRNNVLISTVLRDFQFNVEHCNFSVVSDFNSIKDKCENELDFVNKSSGDVFTYHWDFGVDSILGDTSIAKDPSFKFPKPGKYEVALTVFGNSGCSRKSTKTFHILESLTGIVHDSTVCYGSVIQIGQVELDSGITYDWIPATGLSNSSISNPSVEVTSDRTYKVERHNSTCYVEASVNLKADKIKADFVHEYLPPCDGLRVKFFNRSTNMTSHSWDFGDPKTFSDTSSLDSTSWFYQDSGIVYVKLVAQNERCSDSVTKPLRIFFPEIFTTEIETAICFGDSVKIGPLNDTSILSFTWTPTHFMNNSKSLYPMVRPDSSLSYTLTKTYAHCTLKDSFIVTINELANFGVTRDGGPDICLGDSVVLTATGDPSYQYEWFPKDSLSNPFQPITVAKPSKTTLYTLKVLTIAGCAAIDTITVPLFPQYIIDLDPSFIICSGSKFLPNLIIPDSKITYTIEGSDIIIDSISDEGNYVVSINTKCQSILDTFQVAHYKKDYCNVDLPNAFTPTGDGLNDTYPFGGLYKDIFGIECLFEDYSLTIFNRWGEVVFQADKPTQEWDGRYKNNNGNADVFGYYLTYREYNYCTGGSEIRVKRGNITVLP